MSFVNNLTSGNLAAQSPIGKALQAPSAPALKAAAPANSPGYFWKGGDGKVYVQGSGGINAAGTWDANSANYWAAKGFHQTADSPTKQVAGPPDPNNTTGSGGGSGPVYADKSDDLAVQNAGLGTVDGQTQGAIDKINGQLASVLGGYNTETTANTKNYTDQSNNNTNQFQTGKQTALVNAAAGRRGLLGTLGSIGALSADGVRLANEAVQHGANEDLSGASQTFAGNQSSLDTALGTYTAADKARRDRATAATNDDVTNAKNGGATAKQNFLVNISNDYAAEGDKGNAAKYSAMAAALYPEISATNVPTKTVAPEAAAYTPSTLASYLSKGNTIVQTSAPTTAGGLTIPGLAATTKKQTPVGAAI